MVYKDMQMTNCDVTILSVIIITFSILRNECLLFRNAHKEKYQVNDLQKFIHVSFSYSPTSVLPKSILINTTFCDIMLLS